MSRVARRNLSQTISDDLLRRVREGEYRVGDRLPTEHGLMAEYDVGRNVVREAVQHLVAWGIVDVRPRRGTTVTAVAPQVSLDAVTLGALTDDDTVDDLYSFRLLLETAIAEQAAMRSHHDDLTAMEAALGSFRTALEAGAGMYAADVQFHRAIAAATDNVVFARVLDSLEDLLKSSRQETDGVPGAPEEALQQHTEILAAISARDPQRARVAMEAHVHTAIAAVASARAARGD